MYFCPATGKSLSLSKKSDAFNDDTGQYFCWTRIGLESLGWLSGYTNHSHFAPIIIFDPTKIFVHSTSLRTSMLLPAKGRTERFVVISMLNSWRTAGS